MKKVTVKVRKPSTGTDCRMSSAGMMTSSALRLLAASVATTKVKSSEANERREHAQRGQQRVARQARRVEHDRRVGDRLQRPVHLPDAVHHQHRRAGDQAEGQEVEAVGEEGRAREAGPDARLTGLRRQEHHVSVSPRVARDACEPAEPGSGPVRRPRAAAHHVAGFVRQVHATPPPPRGGVHGRPWPSSGARSSVCGWLAIAAASRRAWRAPHPESIEAVAPAPSAAAGSGARVSGCGRRSRKRWPGSSTKANIRPATVKESMTAAAMAARSGTWSALRVRMTHRPMKAWTR